MQMDALRRCGTRANEKVFLWMRLLTLVPVQSAEPKPTPIVKETLIKCCLSTASIDKVVPA